MRSLKSVSLSEIRAVAFICIMVCLCTTAIGQSPTSLSYPTPNAYVANVSNVYLAPSVAGNVTSYSISPALPAGVTLNTNTGVISGVATATSGATTYTVTATGGSPSGITTASLSLQVTSSYFNNAYGNLNFGGTGVTITPKVGTGTSVGNIVLYQNIATISGQVIDAIVKTTALTSGSTYSTYDQTAASGSGYSNNEERFFSPQFSFASGGSVTFDFQFILGGSYNNTTNTGTNITLQNVQINSYDIDGNGSANSNQFNEFGGFSSSTLGSSSTVDVTYNDVTDLSTFRSNTTANSSTVITDATRVKVTYMNVSDFRIQMGGLNTTYFFVDFGAGPGFTTGVTSAAPTVDLNTSVPGVNNALPASSTSLPFTGATQSNITSTTALNELFVSFPTASILNGASEQLLINSATSGETIALNFANAAAISNIVLGATTYKVVAAVSGGISTLTFSNNTGTMTVAQAEALMDAFRYSNTSTTPASGNRPFTVNVRNAAFKSPNAVFTAFLNYYTISGLLYRDSNGMTDNLVNSTGTQLTANAAYVVRVNTSTNTVIDSKGVAAGGAYSFSTVIPGSYAFFVSSTAPVAGTSFTAATYPTGYASTGENLSAATGNDNLVDGKILVTVGSANLPAVNLGIEIAPVATAVNPASQPNPGGFNTYTIPNGSITATDADGTVSSITITEFPTGANYLKIGSTVYANPSGGACPTLATCATWPGTVTIPYSGGNPAQTISVDPSADVTTSVAIKFIALDNANIPSSVATLTIPFAVTNYKTITGNVWSDYNGDGIKDAAEPLNAAASSGQTLYVVLIQNNNTYSAVPTIFSASAVDPNTGYTLSNAPSGNNYEVWLVSASSAPVAGAAATTITRNLATGWMGVSTTNGAAVTNHLNTINLVIAVNNLASALSSVSFGIQKPAISDTKTYTNVNAGTGGPLNAINIANTKNGSVTYVKSLTMSGTSSSGSTPSMLTGSDPDGGAGGAALSIGSGTAGYSIVIDPTTYSNSGSALQNPTMLIYNGVQLHAGGCQGSDMGKPFCSNYNSTTSFWEIPAYDGSLMKVLATPGTTQIGFNYAWKDPSGATGVFNNYNVGFNSALPLRLVSFDAKNGSENSVLLEWKTVGENNTDHFDIERSTDGMMFTKTGSVKAEADVLSGNYRFTDLSPLAGSNYYRLAMYDLDGSIRYSSTQLIQAKSIRHLSVLPNPVKNSSVLTIYWKPDNTGIAMVTIYESTGRQVYQGKLDASGKAVVPVHNWPAGIYSITLDNGKRKEFSKLAVEK